MTKKTIILSLLTIVLSSAMLIAQNPPGFEYTYDTAGNRTFRQHHDNLPKIAINEYNELELNDYKILVYPNPTEGIMQLEIENISEDTKASIEIYNIEGVMLSNQQLNNNSTNNRWVELDISSQPNGIYILRIIIDGKIGDWKVVKQE